MVGRYWTGSEVEGFGHSLPTNAEFPCSLPGRNQAGSHVLRYLGTKARTHTAKSPNRPACIRGDRSQSGAIAQSINRCQPVRLTATGNPTTQAEDALAPSSEDNKLTGAFGARALSQIKNAPRQQCEATPEFAPYLLSLFISSVAAARTRITVRHPPRFTHRHVARQKRAPSMACVQSVQVRYADPNPRNA